MKKYLTMIAAAALTLACSNETEEMVTPQGDAIAFSASMDGSTTRALGEISTDGNLQLLSYEASNHDKVEAGFTGVRGIGIFGCYTGKLMYEQTSVTCDYFYNQQVTWDNAAGKWSYAPVKYWPNENGEYASFFAYAPYEPNPQDDGRCIIDISDNYVKGDPWVNYRLSRNPWGLITDPADPASECETQVDLMFGTKRIGDAAPYTYNPWTDVQHFKQDGTLSGDVTIDNMVNFTFNHALACVGEKIRIAVDQKLADKLVGYASVKLNSLTIVYKNLTNKARLVLNSADGKANWKEIISGELTTTRTWTTDFGGTPVEITFTAGTPNTAEVGGTSIVADTDPATEEGYLIDPANPNADGNGLFYIPLQIAGTEAPYAEITLNYTVDNGITPYTGEGTTKFDLDMSLEGKKQNIEIVLGEDLQLHHVVLSLGSPATEPSYSRISK